MLFSKNYTQNKEQLKERLRIQDNFDLVCKDVRIGEKSACFFFVNGFTKDETMQKLLTEFLSIAPDTMAKTAEDFSKEQLPYMETNLINTLEQTVTNILSGMTALLVDGYQEVICIDVRTYPARDVSQPEKDKVQRGSKDGFVETIVSNTALIRRRIRDPKLTMEMLSVGSISHTDVVLCYMEDLVDRELLNTVRCKIQNIPGKSLTMNQESLAECLCEKNWWNPFPKFKYSERPDTSVACILEGDLVVLVDNSPSAMILPSSLFDIMEEADDYYFSPIIGTYLRISRFLILLISYFITPLFLLLIQNPQWIPDTLSFILLKDTAYVPLLLQFLLLELAIDGLRLAAVNTPNMLTTPLSIVAGLALGEYAVTSGWFNSESMLYMAFVAVSTYSQPSYELGYAMKFFRILTLILTWSFQLPGLLLGVFLLFFALLTNRTLGGTKRYLYPLIPFNGKKLKQQLLRIPRSKDL